MGHVTPLLDQFRGFQTDPPLDQMPRGFVRKVRDFIPQPVFAMAESRGPWLPGTGQVSGANAWWYLTYAPFTSGTKIALNGNHTQFSYVTTLDGTTTGTALTALGNSVVSPPIFHLTAAGGLVILPGAGTGGIPRKWDGSGSHADLGGTPPAALLAASWGDYLILARTGANPNRMYFSGVGNPESWPANNYIDFPEAIQAIVPRGNTIFVFGSQYLHILVGDTPPPGGNQTLRKNLFPHGVDRGPSAFGVEGVTTYKDYVIWVNAEGVFKGDGSQPIDLTQGGGISSYWLYLRNVLAPTDRIALGVYRNYLFVSIVTSGGVARTCLIYDLEENSWWEWSNIGARQLVSIPKFAGSANTGPDLLWIDAVSASPNQKIVGISQCFTGSDAAGSPFDGNSAGPSPQIITGSYRLGGYTKKRIRRGFLTFIQRPSVSIQIDATWDTQPSPNADPTGYVANEGTSSTFTNGSSATNIVTRRAFRIDRKVEMLQFKIAGTDTGLRIYGLEIEGEQYTDNRAGDMRNA